MSGQHEVVQTPSANVWPCQPLEIMPQSVAECAFKHARQTNQQCKRNDRPAPNHPLWPHCLHTDKCIDMRAAKKLATNSHQPAASTDPGMKASRSTATESKRSAPPAAADRAGHLAPSTGCGKPKLSRSRVTGALGHWLHWANPGENQTQPTVAAHWAGGLTPWGCRPT